MKLLLQSLRDGTIEVAEVPAPRAAAGQVLIRTTMTLVSAGTERMLVEFGKASWLARARQQPDRVKSVLEKVGSDGLVATFEAVRSKLDQPLALGYCNVGVVEELGPGVEGFRRGDRVVSNGGHAELVCVPKNLCARIPDGVSDEEAVFTVLAAVGLQGIRLTGPALGECVVVIGLGLIGLLTVQMLRAQGCRVLGIDLDPQRLALARQLGAEAVDGADAEAARAAAQTFSRQRGVDAVIIAASTDSSDPVSQAARMCRQRGRIVLVGMTGLQLSRSDFYEKELTFQVSCSYGPGRYDDSYEVQGNDYPLGFVRWTEQRNFEAVLDLLAAGSIDVAPLVSHRYPLERAPEAYDLLSSSRPSMGIVLNYSAGQMAGEARRDVRAITLSATPTAAAGPRVAFIGAGNYAGRVLIPAFSTAGASLHSIVSSGGVSAAQIGRKHGFARASTDIDTVLADAAIDTVVVATRHDAHARQVLAALRAGKHVFCEKPLCLTLDELAEIGTEARRRTSQRLMVGFNRRFAPQVARVKSLLGAVGEPKNFVMTVNAGPVAPDHWVQDKTIGGGRIVGEGCHFVDLLRHLAGQAICRYHVAVLGPHPALAIREDKAAITLEFADGSVGSILYLANGDRRFPKERLEIFCAGGVLQLDNFRRLRGWGWKGFSRMTLWRQDKGQIACARAFVDAVRKGLPSPIPLDELMEVSRISIELQDAAESRS